MAHIFKVTPNYSRKTFTIRKNGSKYRTDRFTSYGFEDALDYTLRDWENWLKVSQSYYSVK